jgi:hypothetical protein
MARPVRPLPRDTYQGWPDIVAENVLVEVARQFAENVRAQVGDQSVRSCAERCDISHVTLKRILDGTVWPDMYTIAKLEIGFNVDLWPGRIER